MKRVIPTGAMIPRGYGLAWYAPNMDATVCLPLGLNALASWIRAAYLWLRFPRTAYVGAVALMEARSKGREDGMATAALYAKREYERGLGDGRRALALEMKADVQALRRLLT